MSSDQKQEVRVHIRWMIRRDMPEVLDIEAESFEFPWLEEDFIRCLRQRNCIGMVAEHDDRVVGFMIYELNKTRIHVLNFAVAAEYRRRGVGTQMVAKLIGKLSSQRRTRIMLEVRETNLPAQLFFRDSGFRAVSVLRDYYEDTPEDAYLMQYRYRPERPAVFQPTNRIAHRAGRRPGTRRGSATKLLTPKNRTALGAIGGHSDPAMAPIQDVRADDRMSSSSRGPPPCCSAGPSQCFPLPLDAYAATCGSESSPRPATTWASCGNFAGKKPEDTRDPAHCKGGPDYPTKSRPGAGCSDCERSRGGRVLRSVRDGGATQRVNRCRGGGSGHVPGPLGDDPPASPRNATPVEFPLANAASHANDQRTQWENQRSVSAPALVEIR